MEGRRNEKGKEREREYVRGVRKERERRVENDVRGERKEGKGERVGEGERKRKGWKGEDRREGERKRDLLTHILLCTAYVSQIMHAIHLQQDLRYSCILY